MIANLNEIMVYLFGASNETCAAEACYTIRVSEFWLCVFAPLLTLLVLGVLAAVALQLLAPKAFSRCRLLELL